MRRIKKSLLLLALISAFGTPSGPIVLPEDRDCPPAEGDGRAYRAEIISNKPFIEVRLNGSRPLHFILDAGSPFASLDSSVAKGLGFTVAREERDGNGYVDRRFAPSACVGLLGVTLPGIELSAFDAGPISAVEGARVDGLIGGDILTRHVVEIDYVRGTARAFPASFEYQGDGIVLPVTIGPATGLPYAEAALQKPGGDYVPGRFIVDTGVRLALLINGPFAERNGLLEGQKVVRAATVGVGVLGETRADLFRLRDFRLGSRHLPGITAAASRDDRVIDPDSGLAGVIGGSLLRRFRVIFDYPHGRLILEPTPQSGMTPGYDGSGTFLLAEGRDLRSIRVHRVIPDSPADQAGVLPDDLIVSIDGHDAGGLGLERIRQMFQAYGKRYRLELDRGGRKVKSTLATADLLQTRAATLYSGPAPE